MLKVSSSIKSDKHISIWPWVEKWLILKSLFSAKASSLSFGVSGNGIPEVSCQVPMPPLVYVVLGFLVARFSHCKEGSLELHLISFAFTTNLTGVLGDGVSSKEFGADRGCMKCYRNYKPHRGVSLGQRLASYLLEG